MKHLNKQNQRQIQLEQQLRDTRLTSDKHQINMQAQLDAYSKQCSQQDNQINALETANNLLKNELNLLQDENTNLTLLAEQDKEKAEKI